MEGPSPPFGNLLERWTVEYVSFILFLWTWPAAAFFNFGEFLVWNVHANLMGCGEDERHSAKEEARKLYMESLWRLHFGNKKIATLWLQKRKRSIAGCISAIYFMSRWWYVSSAAKKKLWLSSTKISLLLCNLGLALLTVWWVEAGKAM